MIKDIEDDVFWKEIYCLLCAVIPALKLLQYCDFNIPAMDNIYFLVKRQMKQYIIQSCFWMIKIYMGLQEELPYQNARKNLMKFLEKQIQKEMTKY